MGDIPKTRTRFARVYPGGSMSVCPATYDFVDARDDLIGSSDDQDVELLEVEINVIRTHGRPKMQTVTEIVITCPTCGEVIYADR